MLSKEFNPEFEADINLLKNMFTYVEPLKSTIPVEFSNALLYAEAGGKQTIINRIVPWQLENDKYESKKGTSYKVTCDGTWKDAVSSAWQGKEIIIDINCTRGITGSLYVFIHDWNDKERFGDLFFEGREYNIAEHGKNGIWIKINVMREDSNDGILELKAKVKVGPNLMISKIALVEE